MMYREYTSTSSNHHGENAASLDAAGYPSDAAPAANANPTPMQPAPAVQPAEQPVVQFAI